MKAFGRRLPGCSAEAFAERAASRLPAEPTGGVAPVVETIRELTGRIRGYDRELERLVRQHYPMAAHLQQIGGVGR